MDWIVGKEGRIEIREVFFEACLAASPSPSAELLKAAARHKEVIQRAD